MRAYCQWWKRGNSKTRFAEVDYGSIESVLGFGFEPFRAELKGEFIVVNIEDRVEAFVDALNNQKKVLDNPTKEEKVK